ncbi:MAG: hypothetical protein QXW39_09935 [Candidatus Bathyarchaeia archaeon]
MVKGVSDSVRPKVLEAILATYLTDGHYNGISIGVRNIDPIIFKHLADLKLIKSIFIVKGTGDTWSFGSYFSKELSDVALNCLEGPRKPFARIKNEILKDIDYATFFKWIVEYEGDIFINRWTNRLLLVVSFTQYEPILESLNVNAVKRLKLSVKNTKELMLNGVVTPTRLWLDDVIEEFMRQELNIAPVKYYKYYQIEATKSKVSFVHNYQIYTDVTTDNIAVEHLCSMTLEGTWKSIVANIICEAIQAYHKGYINSKDIHLIKKVLSCNIERPFKGPYNEYIMRNLPAIYPLILNGTRLQVHKKLKKFEKLKEYLSIRRKKSLNYLLRSMPLDEVERLRYLTLTINSLGSLFRMLQEGSTPIGRIKVMGMVVK